MIVEWLEPNELYQIMKNRAESVIVVDVRDDDFEEGKICSSINIPSESILINGFPLRFLERFQNVKQPVLVVFHCFYSQCRGPACAEALANALQNRENVRIAVLTGGYQQWITLYPQLTEKIPTPKENQ